VKVAILSDLHLSRLDGACAFGHSCERFAELVDQLLETHDKLLLGGDVFDLDVGPSFWDHAGELKAAREAWGPLLARLKHPRVRWVFGNHDQYLEREGVPEVQRLESDGTRLMLMHGHQFGATGRWLRLLKYTVKWIAAWDQRAGLGALGGLLYKLNTFASNPVPGAQEPQTRRALKALKSMSDVDILICGHSHNPLVIETGAGIYANSGACSFGRLDWLSVDMKTREVMVCRGQV